MRHRYLPKRFKPVPALKIGERYENLSGTVCIAGEKFTKDRKNCARDNGLSFKAGARCIIREIATAKWR